MLVVWAGAHGGRLGASVPVSAACFVPPPAVVPAPPALRPIILRLPHSHVFETVDDDPHAEKEREQAKELVNKAEALLEALKKRL